MTNLDTLSLAELKQLHKDITKAIIGFDSTFSKFLRR